jgi:predicted RNA-binding protein with PIN domain
VAGRGSGTAGSEPRSDRIQLLVGKLVSPRLQTEEDIGAAGGKHLRKPLRLLPRDERILAAPRHEDRRPCEIRPFLVELERHHGVEERGARHRAGAQEQHARRNVGSVRVTEGHEVAPLQSVVVHRSLHEVGEVDGSSAKVLFVEDSHRDPSKEARHPVLQHLTARTQKIGLGRELTSEGDQVVLIAARSMKQQQREVTGTGLETMNEAEVEGQADLGRAQSSLASNAGSRGRTLAGAQRSEKRMTCELGEHEHTVPESMLEYVTMPRWLIDGMNVIGSRPDGWWNDRRAAMERLADQVARFASVTAEPVTIVFDARPFSIQSEVDVVFAPGGPDAADDEIVEIVARALQPSSVKVVSSDRELIRRAAQLGAEVMSAGSFLRRLDKIAP